ncbi:Rid family hydrolase [Martelella mangrovi]|uniref:Enamine deaminase RidA (YjgF/YER057c/UK114 family) n=1 Tax=Martelella mangrovi TaxID=1397477 RepID=A0ABV2ID79_9HYPH
MTIKRIPIEDMRYKSKVAFYHLPGGGGFMWAVATSRDTSVGLPEQAAGALAVIDEYLKDAGLDRTRIVKAEVVVTDHDQKPAFDKVWSEWMPIDHGPVRSFVQSVMPEGDQVEIIITVALPADYPAP